MAADSARPSPEEVDELGLEYILTCLAAPEYAAHAPHMICPASLIVGEDAHSYLHWNSNTCKSAAVDWVDFVQHLEENFDEHRVKNSKNAFAVLQQAEGKHAVCCVISSKS